MQSRCGLVNAARVWIFVARTLILFDFALCHAPAFGEEASRDGIDSVHAAGHAAEFQSLFDGKGSTGLVVSGGDSAA